MTPAQTATPSIDEVRAQVSQLLESIAGDVPIAAIVLFKVNRTKETQFIDSANLLTEATRRLPGVNVFSFHKAVVPGDALEYLIYEDWETRDFFRTQWESHHLKRFQYTVGDLIVAPPDLRFYHGWPEYRKAQSSGAGGNLYPSFLTIPWQISVAGLQMMSKMLDPAAWINTMSEVAPRVDREATWSSWKPAACKCPAASPKPPFADPPGQDFGAVTERTYGHAGLAAQSSSEPDISPDYPFAPHYVEVNGSKIHYIEQGEGDPILLLHGNPTWSYVWRNIIPHLSSLGHCIAPDLVGYGRSDKPDIRYTWFDHVSYLEGFIDRLNLDNITLVLHDHGSGLGFHYAMQHPEKVRGITFFEAIIRPFPWDHFSSPSFREIFKKFRTGDIGDEGWKLIVDQNMFIEQLLPQAAGRDLSDREMNYYREPFRQPMSRMPIWRLARETPIGGEPQDVWDAVSDYSWKLQKSAVPKLMLYATPGALLTQEHVEWVQNTWQNLRSVNIGPGIHFLQESSPHRIGLEVACWLETLSRIAREAL